MPGQTTSLPSETPAVSWGPTSTLGTALTLLGIVGTVVAAVHGNDTATATSGAATALAALTTLGGRMAQAIAIARSAAVAAGPWIDTVQAALAATPTGTLGPVLTGTAEVASIPVVPVPDAGETVTVARYRHDDVPTDLPEQEKTADVDPPDPDQLDPTAMTERDEIGDDLSTVADDRIADSPPEPDVGDAGAELKSAEA
jgi:hypothetical protein